MAPSGALRLGCVWIAASSEIAYSAPAIHSRRRSAMNWAPNSLPASSSAVARNTRSRLSGTRPRLSASIAARCRMPVDFMSIAPRP